MRPLTLAWPLALAYLGLVVYASLYPFAGWRTQDAPWLAFMGAATPPGATRFDVWANLLGYAPLGFLLAVALLRRHPGRWVWLLAVLLPSAVSLLMEALQVYLPSRVPSRLDWQLNSAGGALGVLAAALAQRTGLLALWARQRGRWFVPEAHGALVLLALWPWALLYPTALPFGLGQVGASLTQALAQGLAGTPWAAWWVSGPPQPLSLAQVALGVAAGLLAPCLLGYSVLRGVGRRALHSAVVLALGVGMVALSAALTHGPQHAWSWWSEPVAVGVGLALVAALLLVGVTRRAALVWLLLALMVSLTLLNRLPEVPYLAESQGQWAQGRFIRFYGLTQWLGWLWPYLTLLHALRHSTARRPRAAPQPGRTGEPADSTSSLP